MKNVETKQSKMTAPKAVPDSKPTIARKKGSSKLDDMAAQALKEHREGKTRPFPE